MSKKQYSVPLNITPNSGSWNSDALGADYKLATKKNITYEPPGYGVFDIDMPIHPDYVDVLNPAIAIGDLVETHDGLVGIVVGRERTHGFYLQVKNANNYHYTVLIDEKEKKFIGYSLKKLDK